MTSDGLEVLLLNLKGSKDKIRTLLIKVLQPSQLTHEVTNALLVMSDALIKLFQDPNESENLEIDDEESSGRPWHRQHFYNRSPRLGPASVRFPPAIVQVKIKKVGVTTALRNHMRVVFEEVSSWTLLTMYLGMTTTF